MAHLTRRTRRLLGDLAVATGIFLVILLFLTSMALSRVPADASSFRVPCPEDVPCLGDGR
jgi:hypothetical protein